MEKLGELTAGNIGKTIDSLSYLLAQIDKLPAEFKIESLKLVRQQTISLLLSLNKFRLLFKSEGNESGNLSETEKILTSSLRAQNKLNAEMQIASLRGEKKDAELDFWLGMQKLIDG